MAKVLFLASWYPSRVNAFDGDFIERHAKAISLYNRVFVIYIVKDPGIKDGKPDVVKEISGNIISYKGYYPYSRSKKGWREKLHSNLMSFSLFKNIYQTIVAEYGAMDITHLNILMKAGLYAWRLKKKYKLPYILTEHWTGYDKESKNGYRQQSRLYKFLSKIIYRNCVYPLPVTHDLGEKMNILMVEKTFKVIPNVVDTQFFYPDIEHKNLKKRFIHASTLGYHKNIQGILHATKRLYQQRKDFELYLLGPASANLIHQAEDYGLADNCIFFTGEVSYPEVAEHIRKADAMVMFSRYENLPCVILEALTCGLPVISTDVGGVREIINEGNGILIPSEDEDALLQAMNRMLDTKEKYNKQKIASDAKNKFSYEVVGKQFDEIYKEVLSHKI